MSSYEFDSAALVETFLSEAEEILVRLEQGAVELEHGPSAELIPHLFRYAHTLKGSAACVSFDATAAEAHRLEDRLAAIRAGEASISAQVIDDLLIGTDRLRDLIRTEASAAAETRTDGESEPEGGAKNRPAERMLRVAVSKLDRLLEVSGEIAIARSRLETAMQTLPPAERDALLELHHEGDRLYEQLNEIAMQSRMVPIGPLFRQFNRTVRDLAAKTGKSVAFTFVGVDVEIDTAVADALRDPLTHIIRNAIDHGIRTPLQRRAAGKRPVGQIRLTATHENGFLVVTVEDDGDGLDEERIAARARALGLLKADDVVPREQLLDFIFVPGFSTAEAVTDVSGRGVGMDIVRKNVQRVRGQVGVESRPGLGTRVTLRAPLMLAIIPALGVRAGEEMYLIPSESVLRCTDVPVSPETAAPAGLMELDGVWTPFIRLARRSAGVTRELALVVPHGAGRVVIIVDEIGTQTSVVVKALGALFRGVPGVAGATILGNGRVSVIVDVNSLLTRVDAAAQLALLARSQAPAVSPSGGFACFNE